MTKTYAYDSMNRLTNRTDQLGRVEVYRYDKAGNPSSDSGQAPANFVGRRGISATFKS
jgi:YD repeat-containing protein